jgi:hypothetical protein
MANTPARVTSAMGYSAFMAAVNDLLQLKHDPRGSEVSDLDTVQRAGAAWGNMVDDALIALWSKTDDITAESAVTYDTRESPTVTSAVVEGAEVDFQIALSKTRATIDWLRVRANAGSVGGMVRLYADSDRTKQVYESDIAAGDPPEPSDELVDGTPFACISSDGTSLDDEILYGTIVGGTPDEGPSSTYSIYLVGHGY